MSYHLSPIALDMGAKHTGCCLLHYEDSGNIDSKGVLVEYPEKSLTLSQENRRAKRHQRRGYQRAKLARRLLPLLMKALFDLNWHELSKKETELLYGLLKRRGFNRFEDEENDGSLLDENPEYISAFFEVLEDKDYKPSEKLNLLIQSAEGREALKQCKGSTLDAKKNSQEIKDLCEGAGIDKRPAIITSMMKTVSKIDKRPAIITSMMKTVSKTITSAERAHEGGHHHRREYLEHIRMDVRELDCFAFLRNKLDTAEKQDEFLNALGHLANLQLRVLRRYFNDKTMSGGKDRWDLERLSHDYHRWLNSWHVKAEASRQRNELLKKLEEEGLEKFFKSVNPERTIPPYEDQNNRRPPRCQTLVLDPEKLDQIEPKWQSLVSYLRDKDMDSYSDFEACGISRQTDSKILQRALDRSRETDPLNLAEVCKNGEPLSALPEEIAQKVMKLYQAYKEEREQSSKGNLDVEDSRLLKLCNRHPRHKKSMAEILLAAILGTIPRSDLPRKTEEAMIQRIGRRTIKGICESAAKAVKVQGNGLDRKIRGLLFKREKEMEIEDCEDCEDKELLALADQAERAAEVIADHLNLSRHQSFANLFSLSQIYNILFEDRHGFGKTCMDCAKEDAFRSRKQQGSNHAPALRLPSLAMRPFDGYIRILLEQQAKKVARNKFEQLKERGVQQGELLIPLLIEENRFLFASDLTAIKTTERNPKTKEKQERANEEEQKWLNRSERIRMDGKGICPYTGERIQGHIELDHILPRSLTRKTHGGRVFDNEANLIACSNRGNIAKGNQQYDLSKLSPSYLQAVFGTSSIQEITARIQSELQPYLNGIRELRCAFHELPEAERQAFRHGLFVNDLREELLRILPNQIMTRVNGTQRWFAALIRKELKALCKREMPELKLSFDTMRIDNVLLHRLRDLLAVNKPEYRKDSSAQGIYSHIIDAGLLWPAYLWAGGGEELESDLKVEQVDELLTYLPDSARVDRLESRSTWRRDKVQSKSLMKDGIFATHFFPVLIFNNGKVKIGFHDKNSSEVLRDREQFLRDLIPFLQTNSDSEVSVDSLMQSAGASAKGNIVVNVDKNKALDYLLKVAKQPTETNDLKQATLLESLLYLTQKKEVSAVLLDKNKLITVKKYEGMFSASVKIQNGPYAFEDRKIILPVKAEWEKLLRYLNLLNSFGEKKPADLDFNHVLPKYFSRGQNGERKHRPVRKNFSLPICPTLSGTVVYIKRKTPSGFCWQTQVIDGNSKSGFAVTNNQVQFGKTVDFSFLKGSGSVFYNGERFQDIAGESDVVYMDEWRQIKVPEAWADRGVLKMRMKPNSQKNCSLICTVNHEVLKQLDQVSEHWQALQPGFKPDAKQWRNLFGDDFPVGRQKFRAEVVTLMTSATEVSFLIKETPTSNTLKHLYNQARGEKLN